ncbi:MAG: hypothetical protein JXA46_07925 [Dehalococcoidales bacterium]|nr:hypothetical protein [Dehalococcoidales bacterium]
MGKTKEYVKPEEVTPSQAEKVLSFLNGARTAEEIAAVVEFPRERDVGIKVAQNILEKRAQLGEFKNLKQVDDVYHVGPERFTEILKALGIPQKVSGTYRSATPPGWGLILELRVDVDGRNPQNRISGDIFCRLGYWGGYFTTLYLYSFVVESLTAVETKGVMTMKGPVKFYNDAGKTGHSIEITIPRAPLLSPAADATVKFYKSGALYSTFLCPRTSGYFRTVELEIDRFQSTTYPSAASTGVAPHPTDLTSETLTCADIYRRAGIDMKVTEDDVLNDADSGDAGSNWDEGELHDLMETHFDNFADTLQWNCYGVIVPKFGNPNYNPGYFGVMFDWGGWQTGDTYLRQGAAIAYDALQGYSSGTLYNTAAKKARFFLETFVHEIGHAFNLPHTWSRTDNADSGSKSFMNYPWRYSGGVGGENAFWSDFRWEFDDVELVWMRHGNRKDVIFGGNDWIGNNLSIYSEPQIERSQAALNLGVRAQQVFDFGQPVQVEIKLKNVTDKVIKVDARLRPEDGLVTFYIIRPNHEIIRYSAPVRRDSAPGEVDLAPGESLYESALLSYGARGAYFQEPGEYFVRAYYDSPTAGTIVSSGCRFRVAAPFSRSSEELAHLVFSPEAAKFLYYGGIERYPGVISNLKEAVEKYAASDPAVVRHIAASLGKHAGRSVKQVITKKGQRIITLRKANLEEAIKYLEIARLMLPERNISAMDNVTYNRLSANLADCYLRQDQKAKAEQMLKKSLQYLQKRQVSKTVIEDYKARIKSLAGK